MKCYINLNLNLVYLMHLWIKKKKACSTLCVYYVNEVECTLNSWSCVSFRRMCVCGVRSIVDPCLAKAPVGLTEAENRLAREAQVNPAISKSPAGDSSTNIKSIENGAKKKKSSSS